MRNFARTLVKTVGMKALLSLLLVAVVPTCIGSEKEECSFSDRLLAMSVSRDATWALAEGSHWRKLGRITSAKRSLCAFHYSAVVGTGKRGVDRLVIFLADGTYAGSYRLTLPNNIEVRQGEIRIQTSGAGTDSVDLSSEELPASIFVEGEVIPLMR